MFCHILKAIIVILTPVRTSKSYQHHNDHSSIPVVDMKLYIVYLIVRCDRVGPDSLTKIMVNCKMFSKLNSSSDFPVFGIQRNFQPFVHFHRK